MLLSLSGMRTILMIVVATAGWSCISPVAAVAGAESVGGGWWVMRDEWEPPKIRPVNYHAMRTHVKRHDSLDRHFTHACFQNSFTQREFSSNKRLYLMFDS